MTQKKAMLFTLNEQSQEFLKRVIPRTKSKTVDRALRHYFMPRPELHYVDIDDLPEEIRNDPKLRVLKTSTVTEAGYDNIISALQHWKKRCKEQDVQIEDLLERSKRSRFFGLWRRK